MHSQFREKAPLYDSTCDGLNRHFLMDALVTMASGAGIFNLHLTYRVQPVLASLTLHRSNAFHWEHLPGTIRRGISTQNARLPT